MSDLYIRPYDTPHVRRRVLLIVLSIVLAATVTGFLARRGCSTGGDSQSPESPESVEEDPRIAKLLAEKTDSPGEKSEGNHPPTGTPKPNPAASETDGRQLEPGQTGRAPDQKKKPGPKVDAGMRSTPPVADPAREEAGRRLLATAEKYRADRNLLQARNLVLRAMPALKSNVNSNKARDLVGEINIELLTNPHSMPGKKDYTVKSGDTLARLANEYGTTVGLIQQGNNIKGTLIRVGDRLRIFSGSFSLLIDKSANILDVYLDGEFFKHYVVGTGEFNRTPVGEFKITERIHKPTWWRPDGKAVPYGDPENELGTHWLSLSVRGYGIHGTWEPETIGKQASAGCVRLLNEDIEELYTILPLGTEVIIRD